MIRVYTDVDVNIVAARREVGMGSWPTRWPSLAAMTAAAAERHGDRTAVVDGELSLRDWSAQPVTPPAGS
jgi:hypothetical protein